MQGSILHSSTSANSFIHHIGAPPQTDACRGVGGWGEGTHATITSDGSRQNKAHNGYSAVPELDRPVQSQACAPPMRTMSVCKCEWERVCVWLPSSPSFIKFYSFSVNNCQIHKVIIYNYPLFFYETATFHIVNIGMVACTKMSSPPLRSLLPPAPVWMKEIKRHKRPDTQTLWIWLLTWIGSLYLLRHNYPAFFRSHLCLTLLLCQLNSDVIGEGLRWEEAGWSGFSLYSGENVFGKSDEQYKLKTEVAHI